MPMIESNLTPVVLLNFDISTGDFVPNVPLALRILLTLLMTVANGKKYFFELKIIKSYLHTPMTNDRLVGLSMIAIEHHLCQKLEIFKQKK